MKWVTRKHPKTDRIACPWLIRRFIDPDAEIRYVPADQVLAVAQVEAARSFDAPGAEFTHRDGQCTFEVLVEEFGLGADLALVRLASIVHAADIDGELYTDPPSPPSRRSPILSGLPRRAKGAWPSRPRHKGRTRTLGAKLALLVNDAVNVLPCPTCAYLNDRPAPPALPFQDDPSFPAAPRLRIDGRDPTPSQHATAGEGQLDPCR
jgi:hypothetical protein